MQPRTDKPRRKRVLLRIDYELWDQIETCAANDLRSINAEVEYLLREALRGHDEGGVTPSTPEPRDPEEHETR
jgi:hypothetical protein